MLTAGGSSVWDRAVELFWQIKGGRVDYGAEHAARHGHARYGRKFAGLYREWDAAHPVHLIGHSMGGQTVRMLVQMLRDEVSRRQKSERRRHAARVDAQRAAGADRRIRSRRPLRPRPSFHSGPAL